MQNEIVDSASTESGVGAKAIDGGTPELWIPWKAACDKPNARVRMAMVITHVGTSAIDCTRSGNDYAVDCAHARRIAACVNACVGIPTAELEAEGVDALDLTDGIKALVKQRDELAKLLRECLQEMQGRGHDAEWGGLRTRAHVALATLE